MLHRLPAGLLLLGACLLSTASLLTGCRLMHRTPTAVEQRAALRAQIAPSLDVLGARNWIVVADPAYPILAGEGVDVLTVEAGSVETLREVLDMLENNGDLTPRLWRCSELEMLTEKRAPGVRRFRRALSKLTAGHLLYDVTDRIISLQLTQAAQTYRILYIKTDTALPYSCIAIELDSGYWDSDDETELRERMEKLNAPQPPQPLPQAPTAADTQQGA